MASNCKLHCVFCRLKCVEFHQHIAISDLPSLEEMSYVKYYLFHLFVSAYIGMQNMREGQEVFPGMSRVTVENVLPADLVFHSVSALLQYTCCNWQEMLLISASLASTRASLSGQKILGIR